MTAQQILLTLLIALGVFAFIRQIVEGILGSEWFNELYTGKLHQYSLQKAYNKEKRVRIDEEYYMFKLNQLSARDHEKRALAIAYFYNVPSDPRLVEKLIDILPKQRRKDLQERMLRLLCKTFINLLKQKKETLTGNDPASSWEKATSREWSIAISLWLAEIFLITISWFKVITPSFMQILFMGLFLFFVMIGGLRIVIKDGRRFWKITLLAVAFLLATLHFYSKATHTGVLHVNMKSLQDYSLSDVGICINYPNWVTADDVEMSKKAVSVLVLGNNSMIKDTLTLFFNYNPAVLKVTDKDGKAMSPRFDLTMTNPSGEPQEFYIKPLDRNALKYALPTTTITTQIETKTVRRQKVPELDLKIQLENPLWKDIRDLFLFLSPLSFSGGVFWFLWDRLKKSAK